MNDKADFKQFCRGCTDEQLRNVYRKELAARRSTYWRIALEVMTERGLA